MYTIKCLAKTTIKSTLINIDTNLNYLPLYKFFILKANERFCTKNLISEITMMGRNFYAMQCFN